MSDLSMAVPAGLTTEGLIGKRYLARAIDSIFIALLIAPLIAVMSLATGGRSIGAVLLTLCMAMLLWIGYGTILESSPWQATLGKRLMGLRVCNTQGGRLAPLQAAGRNLVKDGPFLILGFVPGGNVASLLWLLAHVIVVHRSNLNQAIHDRVAGTWVAAPELTTRLNLT